MFPNLQNFPLLNFSPLFNILYSEHMISPWIYSENHLKPVLVQSVDKIPQSDGEKTLKITLTKEDLQQEGIGISKKHWTEEEDRLLKEYAELYNFNWTQICQKLPGRNQKMCYSRYRRTENDTKAYWTHKQNQDIKKYFQVDKLTWKGISKHFANRTAKQIREHYLNFLRPNIKRQEWTIQQDLKIIELYNRHGKKWKMFEENFEGRTENQIKNRFYGRLRRLEQRKIQCKQNTL